MDPKTRQRLLFAVIFLCLLIIAYWWYQSPYGPGGRNKYGIVRVSWSNTNPKVGTLVLALSRTPSKNVKGGKVSSISPGLVVSASTSLSAPNAKIVERMLGGIVGQTISDVDTGANTITLKSITLLPEWPADTNWTASTTIATHVPSAHLVVFPLESES
ncbi:hypothetical protein ElyMa_002543600 [Elysia marginata]|uniref:Uncharacterized protein n=1 Tax=Elysia marginata TaxID=1093978 RepID=A0AAV4GUC0_9GAST|nr:hypothetical protein ElyMa_002543600 [Elysia marginata]